MATILLYTFIMMGITFLVGFAVAGLIKVVTNLFTLSYSRIVDSWKTISAADFIRYLRLSVLSETKEANYVVFQFYRSHNARGKDRNKTPDIFNFSDSHNYKEQQRKMPEIFDFLVSHNN